MNTPLLRGAAGPVRTPASPVLAVLALFLALSTAAPLGAQSTWELVAGAEPGTPSPSDLEGGPRGGPSFFVGGAAGYQNGMSLQGWIAARDFAQGLPLEARLRFGYTSLEPGSATDARRIFINNATNGTPEERGRTLDLALDGLLPLGPRSRFYGGVRMARFLANFRYVGGNEDFDVTSTHWGVGGGLEMAFPMGPRSALTLSGGGEYFFQTRLQGHDTSYSPDGDDVNAREDYDFGDADDAINQPRWRPVVTLGVSYRLGKNGGR